MATEPLKSILSDVRQSKIVLPQFQRDFVWQPSAVIKLLTSLFNGYPVGSLLLMENNDSYDFRPIDGVLTSSVPLEGETVLVLDGQQRLTACFRAFFGTLEEGRKHAGRYYFDYKLFVEIIQRGEELEASQVEEFFVFLKPASINKKGLSNAAAEIKDGLLPLDILFGEPRGSNYADWLNKFNFFYSLGNQEKFESLSKISSQFLTQFIEKVTSYQLNYEKITRDTKPDVICTVFETINTTGVKLTVFDLLVAKCFKADIRLRDKLEEALTRYSNISFFDPTGLSIGTTQLPKLIGLLHNGQCKKGDILRLPVEAIRANWDKAVSALDKMLGIMRTEFGCVKIEFIPSMDIITPLSIVADDLHFNKSSHFELFRQVYWLLVFSQHLSGAPESKSARILRDWREQVFKNGSEAREMTKQFAVNFDDVSDATKASAVYKGVISLLIANGAKDFGNKPLIFKDNLSRSIEDHHIFPQKFLMNFDIKGSAANGILNRTPIFKETNNKISSVSPEIYIDDRDVVGEQSVSQANLELHGIDKTLMIRPFSKSVFQDFCADRKQRLMQIISKATGQAVPSSD